MKTAWIATALVALAALSFVPASEAGPVVPEGCYKKVAPTSPYAVYTHNDPACGRGVGITYTSGACDTTLIYRGSVAFVDYFLAPPCRAEVTV